MKPAMRQQASDGTVQGRARVIIVSALFTLVGINLRTVILAVPPVLPQIKHDLGLSYTATGLLTALPVLIMGGMAWPAGWLAGRHGARRMVALGLALLTAGALLRAVWPAALPLYVFTAVLSLGIAIAQTAMPVLARQWFPSRIGLVSALFSDGLILGEVIAAGLTIPLILGIFGPDAWAQSFVAWSIPVAVCLLLWLLLAPPAPALAPARPTSAPAPTVSRKRRGAEERTRVGALHLGILLGSGSLVFFNMNGWIATYNQGMHYPNATAPVSLFVLNAAQVPVSLGMTLFAQQLAGRRWPFVSAGIVCVAAITGLVLTPASLQPYWAALLGGSSSFVFVLGIALPPLLAGREEVARLTGITLTLSYGFAFVGPLIGGGLWDLFGLPALAFLPVAVAGVLLVVLGSTLPSRSAFGLIEHSEPAGRIVGTSLDAPSASPSQQA